MKKVYVSLRGTSETKSQEFLGVFSNHEEAKKRCLSEHSFTRQGWILNQELSDRWDNGYGLYVNIIECELR